MKVLFEHPYSNFPKVSIILLDWNCRESFHSLDYLNEQAVSRDMYEIIWIEYYNRRSFEIEKKLEECRKKDKPPIVDKWIVMEIPDNIYYHKHLMYNIGIIASKGEIVTFCDSDAIMMPTFVESIIKSFDKDPNIILHIDEVRNNNKRFYPFNYPSREEILSKGCINWKDGKTTGLLDKEDSLHTLNYGACMAALREDLINIGGADEHIDYLGHICGPYEMTFRLFNAGKKEVWHQKEFLYHVWHPGTDGKDNYLGPHDGRNMSTTALNVRRTGRIMSLVENPAIKILRLKEDNIIYEPLFLQAIPEEEIGNWVIKKLKQNRESFWRIINLNLAITFFKMLIKQFYMKVTKFSRQPKSIKDILGNIHKSYDFLKNMSQYNTYVIESCNNCLHKLAIDDVNEFAVYGTGDVTEVLYKLTLDAPVKINAVYDYMGNKKLFDFNVMPLSAIRDYKGKIVVASLVGVEDRVEILKKMGITSDKIVLL